MPSLRTTVAAAGLALLTPAAALGALGVGPLRLFSPGSPFAAVAPETTSLALNARGDAVVGEIVRSANGSLVTPTVRTRAGARGAWTSSIRLAAPTADTSEPIVRISNGGDAIAVFERAGRYVASRRRAGAWRLRAVGANSPATADVVNVALLPNGRGRFVQALPDTGCDPGTAPCMWTASIYDQVDAASPWTRRDDSLRFGPATGPVIAASRRGDVVIAWTGSGAAATLNASRRLITETAFEAPITVSPPGVRGEAMAAIGDGGDAVVGWVMPDTPGSTATTFTGAIQVAMRLATSPIWANAETVVQPGTPNPDGALAIDGSANVAVAWTSFAGGAGAADQLRAAIRAAGAQWIASPLLGSAAVDAGESLRNPRVLIDAGRAFVYAVRRLGQGGDRPQLSVGATDGTWSTQALAGNVDPSASAGDTVDYLVGSSPSGRLLLAGDGLQVRSVDANPTPPPALATRLAVTVTGRQAVLRFRLNVAAHVVVQRRSGAGFRRTGEYPPEALRAGARTVRLGRLAPGRYRVAVGACNRSRGCSISRVIAFRIA